MQEAFWLGVTPLHLKRLPFGNILQPECSTDLYEGSSRFMTTSARGFQGNREAEVICHCLPQQSLPRWSPFQLVLTLLQASKI